MVPWSAGDYVRVGQDVGGFTGGRAADPLG